MKSQMLNSPAILRELKVTEAQIGRLEGAEAEADLISRRIGEERRRLRRQYTAEGNEEGLAGLEQGQWKFVLSLSCARRAPRMNGNRENAVRNRKREFMLFQIPRVIDEGSNDRVGACYQRAPRDPFDAGNPQKGS